MRMADFGGMLPTMSAPAPDKTEVIRTMFNLCDADRDGARLPFFLPPTHRTGDDGTRLVSRGPPAPSWPTRCQTLVR